MGKVALVTGSAAGLGVQTVLALAKQGHDIVFSYLTSADKAARLQSEVERLGVRCVSVQADVSKKEDCRHLVSEAVRRLGSVDILVNNAGPYIFEYKKLADYTYEEWELMVNGNLSSVFYLCREAIPLMRKNKWGRIVNFGFTQAGQASGWIYRAAYAAAKVGLVSLTRSLAQEECETGITVNMVCPGDIKGQNKEQTIAQAVEADNSVDGRVARPGTGEDIARTVLFLCSEQSDYISGTVIEVNGGTTLEQLIKRR